MEEKERGHFVISPCSATAEWEGSLLALYREVGDTWSPTPGHKGYEREALLAKRMEEVRNHTHCHTITLTLSHCHTITHTLLHYHTHCHTITHTLSLS